MKIVTIAALVAAQLPAVAAPAQAAELRGEPVEVSTARTDLADGGGARAGESEPGLAEGEALALRTGSAPDSSRASAAEEDRPRKGKSTGDKVLTGAAVILGIGALAVGGLLVAIFVN